MENKTLHVEVAYALPDRQRIVALELAEACTVREAARRAGLQQQFPELDIDAVDLGVFGKVVSKPEEQLVEDGDRVEIYRPLIADPKEVRKQRAAKVRAEKGSR